MAVAVVLLAYGIACGLILTFATFLFRDAKPKKLLIVNGLLVFAMAWPIWMYFGNNGFFNTACAIGNPGIYIYEPIQIDVFTVSNRNAYEQSWNGDSQFFQKCESKCREELNRSDSLLSYHQPWSAIREGGQSVEGTWTIRLAANNSISKHARLWVVPANSPECIATLHNTDNKRCIAGREIDRISARFVASVSPFFQPVQYGDGMHLRPSSMEWRWFGVEKHQHHLLKDGKLVARYVWYVRNLIPNSMFTSISICPPQSRDGVASEGPGAFWKAVLNPQGAQTTAPN